MPIDRVTYQKLFPTEFQFLNIRLGGESSIVEGETWLGQMQELHKQATDYHKSLYPQLYNGEIPIPEPTTLPTLKVERQMASEIEEDIMQMALITTYDDLQKQYGSVVKLPQYSILKLHYDKRLEELK
jgi:hypothetical protein